MYEIKTEDVYEDFNEDKKMFDFSNYSAKSKYYDDSNKSGVGKMTDEKADVAVEKFFGLKPKMYSFLVDDSSDYEKARGLNKNVVVTVSHNECKDVLLNSKCLRHSMNKIQSENHRKGVYEINKTSLSCFDDKIYILDNVYNRLLLVIRVSYLKKFILIIIQKIFFVKL